MMIYCAHKYGGDPEKPRPLERPSWDKNNHNIIPWTDEEIVVLQVMLVGNGKILLEYVSKTDWENNSEK